MQLDVARSIPAAFKDRVDQAPADILFSSITCQADRAGKKFRNFDHIDISCQEVLAHSCRVAHYLTAQGVGKGQRVAIMSDKRAEFTIAALGILMTGASVVLIYPTDTAEDLAFKLWDTKARIIFSDTIENTDKATAATGRTHTFKQPECEGTITVPLPAAKIIRFNQFAINNSISSFSSIIDDHGLPERLPDSVATIQPTDEAYIVYTGGTTGGTPKGVIHTHGGRIANVWQLSQMGLYEDGWTTFLGLNLAHAYLQIIQDVCLMKRMRGVFPAVLRVQDVDKPEQLRDSNRALLIASMAKANAHVIPVVPELLQVVEKRIRASGLMRTLDSGLLKPLGFAQSPLVGRLIRKKLVGPNFEHFISGGGPLSMELVESYRRHGIVILNGYGSSEGEVVLAVSSPTHKRDGTVGKLAPGNEARLVENESGVSVLQVRGPSISSCYLNRPKASAATFLVGGWLNTNDVATIDDGFVTLRGRADDVLVLTTGEKVYPAEIEERLKFLDYIQDAVVVGHAEHFPSALVALDRAAIASWAKKEGYTLEPALNSDTNVRKLIDAQIQIFNKEAKSSGRNNARIHDFFIVEEPFSIESGLRSKATFKVLRRQVHDRYAAAIDELYPRTTV